MKNRWSTVLNPVRKSELPISRQVADLVRSGLGGFMDLGGLLIPLLGHLGPLWDADESKPKTTRVYVNRSKFVINLTAKS